MNLRARLKRLEAKHPATPPDPDPDRLRTADVIRQLDTLISRLRERDSFGPFDEHYDDHLYEGESFDEHYQRVAELLEEHDRQHRAWLAEHRPELLNRPCEIDKHIEELKAEIAAQGGGV